MKTFKKWFKKNIEIYPHTPHDEIEQGLAWRAALEEVLKQVEVSNSDGNIVQWIKDELKKGGK